MTDLVAVHAALVAAGASVEGVRGYSDPGASFDPPAWLVSPPLLRWGAYSSGFPTTAQFVGFLMVKADDRAVENLERLVVLVGQAIYGSEDVDATVGSDEFSGVANTVGSVVSPGVWKTGTTELPCYVVPIEVSL